MTLSEAERKMLVKLRATEAFRGKWRWPMVVLAGGHIVSVIYLLAKVANFPDEPPGAKALVLSHYVAPLLLMLTLSAVWLGYLIANWNGDAKTVLLLKLLDEHRE